MQIYKAAVTIKLLAGHATVEDFRMEIDAFNKANEGVIEVKMDYAKYVDDEELVNKE